MQRHTNRNRALLLSFVLHIILILVLSPFFVTDFNTTKEGISAEILTADPEKRIKRRVLPPRIPLVQRAANAEASADSVATSTYTPRVRVSKAPVHTDIVPDVVTHTDIAQTGQPSPVSNTSFSGDKTFGGPVVIERKHGRGGGDTQVGVNAPELQGSSLGTRFAHETGVSEVGLDIPNRVGAGLGIFGTEVMPGRGLIGEVFVPGGPITRMPNFDHMLPVYTFVTANLDVPTRNYTQGFPTPEIQSVVENFAIRFRAELKIDIPGVYTFGMNSDDGSQLYINGKLVVDNDGIHPTINRLGSIKLGTGIHPVEIRYFQGPRRAIALQLFYQPPNGYRQIVPPGIIYRPDKPQIPAALKKLQQRLKNIRRKKIENTEEQ